MCSDDKRPGRGAVQKIINYIQHDKGYAEKYVGIVSRLIYQFLIELGNYSGRQKKPGRDEQDVTSRQGSFCAYRFYTAIISKSCMQYRNISISYSKVRRNT